MSLEVLIEKVGKLESSWLQKRVMDTLDQHEIDEKTRLSKANDQLFLWLIGVIVLRAFVSLITLGLAGIIYKKMTSKPWFLLQNAKNLGEDLLARLKHEPEKFEPESSQDDEIQIRKVSGLRIDTYTTISRAVMINKNSEQDVAVKTREDHECDAEILGLTVKEEAEILKTLDHKNIVHFVVAGSFENEKFGLVMEYPSHGSLHEFIMVGSIYPNIPWYKGKNNRLSLAMNVAEGLYYLHDTANIVHRNVSTRNILVFWHKDGAFMAKISDFSSVMSLDDDPNEKPFEITNWTAPECMCLQYNPDDVTQFTTEGYDNKVFPQGFDAWSFGLVLYQMSAGKEPFLKFKYKSTEEGYEPLYACLRDEDQSLIQDIKEPGLRNMLQYLLRKTNPHRPTMKTIIKGLPIQTPTFAPGRMDREELVCGRN